MNKIYQCCFCQDYFKGYGNNPQPSDMSEGARCCDSCNATVVIPERISKVYGAEKDTAPASMTVYIREDSDTSPSDSINYYIGEEEPDIEDGSPCPLCNPEGNNDNYLELEGTDQFGRDWTYSCENCDFEVDMSNRPVITGIKPTGNFVYTESTDEFTPFEDMKGQNLFKSEFSADSTEEWGNERTSAVLAGVFATALEGLMSKLNAAIDESAEIEILFFTDCIDYLCSGMAATLAESSKEMDPEIVNAIAGMLAMTALQMDKLRTNPEIEELMNPIEEPSNDSIVDVVVEDANDFGNSLDLDMWAAENETSLLIMEQDLCPVCRGEEKLELIEYPSELCFEHSEAYDDMIFDHLYSAEAFDEKITVWYCGRCSMAHGSDQEAAEICCTAEDPYSVQYLQNRYENFSSDSSEEDYEDIVKISRFMKDTSNAGSLYDDWYWDGEELTIIGVGTNESDEVEKYTKQELIELGVLESSIPSKSFDAETMKKFYDELAGLLNRTTGETGSWDLDGDASEASRDLEIHISMESLPPSFFEEL